jgi:hypothetical protein
MEKIMTRWNILSDLFMARPENRAAIGKAWPLFFLLIFNTKKENRFYTSYQELKEALGACPNTIKDWRDHLVKNQVAKVERGRAPLIFTLLSPYDSLVTCEQDDWAAIRIKTDPKVKRVLDKLSSHDNMSLLPLIVELSAKVTKLEKAAAD